MFVDIRAGRCVDTMKEVYGIVSNYPSEVQVKASAEGECEKKH